MTASRSPSVVIVVAAKSSRKSRSRSAPSRSRRATTAHRRSSVRRVLFGAHVSAAGGISTAIDRAEELGCDAVQVFTQSPRMWQPTAHAAEELERFRERRAEAGIGSVVCHALYLVNLATPDREIHEKSLAAMRASLETAARDRRGRRRLPRRLAPRRRASRRG